MKLQAFDSNHFCGKSHFEDDSTQNYLVLIDISKQLLILIKVQHGNKNDCLMRVNYENCFDF